MSGTGILLDTYKLIRDMELGQDDTEKKMSAAHIKAAKTQLSEENFAILQELGGDVGDHVNKALEVYTRWLQGQESALVPEPELVDRQKVIRNG